jgi:hypothetical protein
MLCDPVLGLLKVVCVLMKFWVQRGPRQMTWAPCVKVASIYQKSSHATSPSVPGVISRSAVCMPPGSWNLNVCSDSCIT